jgi:hypothetical protein
MHESALIFVPAATFGQLIPKCDTAPQPLQLRCGFTFGWSRALAKLVGPALQVEKSEAGGGLICWRRKKYVCKQQATDSFSASSCACCERLEKNAFRPGSRDYFGERMLAWVLMSRLCFSTTRRSSRSMVLNASWMTFLSGS